MSHWGTIGERSLWCDNLTTCTSDNLTARRIWVLPVGLSWKPINYVPQISRLCHTEHGPDLGIFVFSGLGRPSNSVGSYSSQNWSRSVSHLWPKALGPAIFLSSRDNEDIFAVHQIYLGYYSVTYKEPQPLAMFRNVLARFQIIQTHITLLFSNLLIDKSTFVYS